MSHRKWNVKRMTSHFLCSETGEGGSESHRIFKNLITSHLGDTRSISTLVVFTHCLVWCFSS